MEAHVVDSKLGQARGDALRVIGGHEGRVAREVDAEEADSGAVDNKMAIGIHGDPVGADGRVESRKVGHGGGGVIPR
jgi:hypothetical protein